MYVFINELFFVLFVIDFIVGYFFIIKIYFFVFENVW